MVTRPLTCLTQGWWCSKNCCPGVIRLCNYCRDCCFPDKGCLPVWYYFYPEVCSSRKATSTRHNRARKQTLPDTTRDLLAKYDTDLTGEQPHGLYSSPHHRHSMVMESKHTPPPLIHPIASQAQIGHPSPFLSHWKERETSSEEFALAASPVGTEN